MKRLFNETPEQFIGRIQHEHSDGSGAIETRQNITEIVETNRFNYNARSGSRWDHFQNHVASIPTSIYYKLVREGVIDDLNRLGRLGISRERNDQGRNKG